MNKRTHFWYVVDKESRNILDYGSQRGTRAGAYLDLCAAASHHNGG
jgi:hypothetical protein